MANTRSNSDSNGGGFGALLILVATLFLIGPLFLPKVGITVSGLAQAIFALFGVVVLLAAVSMMVIGSCYQKASSNEALVKTGMGGRLAILDGGTLVFGAIHKIQRVSLETVKLIVERSGKDALLTGDNLRVDLKAEFYIKVNPTKEGVINAATSLGDKAGDDQAIMNLVGEKLISAMRTVASRSDLEHLHTQLDKYGEDVKTIVEKDLEPNGLYLETVAISHLNQTSKEHLDPDNNMFDAQGVRKIVEITNLQRVARSKAQTEADKQVKALEVTRDKELFTLDMDRSQADAQRGMTIKNAQAEAERKAAEFQAEQTRQSEIAKVTATQAVEVANVEKQKTVQLAAAAQEKEVQAAQIAKDQAVQTATVAKQQAIDTANVEKQKTVEIKTREQKIAIAEAEQRQATAEASRIAAETDRARKEQEKKTVEETAQAERAKQVGIINQQATSEKEKIQKQVQAEADKIKTVTDAQAQKEAADAKADAMRIEAQGKKDAAEMEADGDKARKMVDVEVETKRVDVKQKEVDVEKNRLENQETYGKAGIELQVRLAAIAANRDVRIEAAKALGQALSGADMKIIGDPTMMQAIMGSFYRGEQHGAYVEGLMEATPDEAKTLAFDSIDKISGAVSTLAKNMFGKDVSPDLIATMVKAELAKTNGAATAVA